MSSITSDRDLHFLPTAAGNPILKTNIFPAGLGRAIAAARPVTPFGMLLAVNSDNSTHRAPDEVYFGR